MAVPRPCAEGPCCSRPSAAPGVQQTLDEMDFERGEAGARPYRPGAFRRPQAPRAKEVAENRGPEGEAAWGPSRSVGGRWAHRSRVVRALQGPGGSSALETPAHVQVGKQALVSGTFPSGAAGPGSSPGATLGHPALLPGLLLGSRACSQGIAPTPRAWSFRPGGLRVGTAGVRYGRDGLEAGDVIPTCGLSGVTLLPQTILAAALATRGFVHRAWLCLVSHRAHGRLCSRRCSLRRSSQSPLSCGTVLRTLGIPQMG